MIDEGVCRTAQASPGLLIMPGDKINKNIHNLTHHGDFTSTIYFSPYIFFPILSFLIRPPAGSQLFQDQIRPIRIQLQNYLKFTKYFLCGHNGTGMTKQWFKSIFLPYTQPIKASFIHHSEVHIGKSIAQYQF